jgi:short-subunit dehydrogenase
VAALECAKRHAHVYMVCRDEKRGKDVQEEIIRETNNPNVELHLCDLSLPQEVAAFAKRFIQTKKPLNVTIVIIMCSLNMFLELFVHFFVVSMT